MLILMLASGMTWTCHSLWVACKMAPGCPCCNLQRESICHESLHAYSRLITQTNFCILHMQSQNEVPMQPCNYATVQPWRMPHATCPLVHNCNHNARHPEIRYTRPCTPNSICLYVDFFLSSIFFSTISWEYLWGKFSMLQLQM